MSDSSVCLTDAQCWDLLASVEFGRLGYSRQGRVEVVPVNYVAQRLGVDEGRLLFRTAAGGKLMGACAGDVVFEVDEVGEERAWSVMVRGRARELGEREAREVEDLPLRPWFAGEKAHVVVIVPQEVSGRSFVLQRPWRRMKPAQVVPPRNPWG
ncbi:pyridoxamine 5'-phosphate oxidase family protein [Dermatophilus congolensis]|uniref:Pyridoxamine 5'-phosphate oxidase n=1 Tax=Dermatophilus congolensis TaxID=1863 RepID=A0A239V801_9MICO|nr:pyridoxamine 5'-phosphate oxidase family protein [Dermatophilus congolensis]MBO3130268.1 pyridoxamine 5'-phosphate oxidase family protein [Dermatophilus congolensis]MBO3131102.1 pyridoxamine 5'-phosphate oxidase family protein [Dermatophilus congolensis]MBO3134739.1 pyridoxamine 5'-phosphate oxidase family protein [Dermatophilus congolensis]MBO3136974.1 pyridoxamine 5'-phosphate oxidase family protein [Dermatophilus congolensis]MBO3139220.1 pyridoxamine 5'-phosphate oxidase family protein [